MEAVATFDVISVRKFTVVVTTRRMIRYCVPLMYWISFPIQAANPVLLNPAAMAKPPPNNSRMPQGNFLAVGQSSIVSPFFAGIRNNT